MNPLISVIIPSFNRAALSLRAVGSVLSQSYRNFELIFVDDGSSEDYSEIQEIVLRNSHKFIRIKQSGVSRARNIGIREASGEFISFLDSDDEWLPEKLKKQILYFESFPESKVLQTYERWIRNGERVNIPKRLLPSSGDIFSKSLLMCCISPSSVMLNREVIEKCGLFDERFIVCEDYDLWLRVSSFYKVDLIEEELVIKYSMPHDQLSSSQVSMDRFRVFALLKYLANPEFALDNKILAKEVLLNKLSILRNGALKRGLVEDTLSYASILSIVAKSEPENDTLIYSELISTCSKLLENRAVA